MTYLPDVNVWIALTSDKHIHHGIAKRWYSSIIQTDEIAFCRITEMGFLRLLTNRHVMGDDALIPKAAWNVYDSLRAAREITFLPETPELGAKWRHLSEQARGGPNMWTDAYLWAFAATHEAKLVTFDRDLGTSANAEILCR